MRMTLFWIIFKQKSVLKGLIFAISMQFAQILMVLILARVIRVSKIFSRLQSLLEVKYEIYTINRLISEKFQKLSFLNGGGGV